MIGWFEDDEEGEHLGVSVLPDFFWNQNGTLTFLTPSSKLICLPKKVTHLTFTHGLQNIDYVNVVTGVLWAFNLDGKRYSINPVSTGLFDGYKTSDGEVYNYTPIDEADREKSTRTVITVYPCDDGIYVYQFNSNGLDLYSGEVEDVLNESFFTFRPFTTELLYKKKYSLSDFNELVAGSDNRFNVTNYEMGMLEPFCGKQEILPVLKIAQIRNLNPVYYTDFESLYLLSDAVEFSNLRNLKSQINEFDFWVTYLERLIEYVKSRNENKASLLDQFTINNSVEDWNILLSGFTIEDYKNLNYEQRIILLKVATKGIIAGSMEKGVRNIFKYTPEQDYSKMLDGLVTELDGSNRKLLLEAICSDFDGVDGEEFTETISTIVNWVFITKPIAESFTIDYALHNSLAIPFKSGLWLGHALEKYFTSSGEVVLKARPQFTSNVLSIEAPPFDYILVEILEDFKVGSITLKEGAKIIVPAIYGYLLFNNENTARLIKAGKIAFDITLFAVGVGELKVALQARESWRLYRAAIDLGVSVTDFTINNVLEDDLKKSPQGRLILSYWNQLTLYYGVASITDAVFTSALNNLKKEVDDIALRKEFIDDNGTKRTITDDEIDDLESLYKDFESKTGVKAITPNTFELSSNSFVKTDPKRLAIFNKFNYDNQQLIAKFTDKDASSTLAKFLDDCDDDFIKLLNDEPGYIEAFASHKKYGIGSDEAFAALEQFAERADEFPAKFKSKINHWLDHSQKANKFGNVVELGNQLSKNIFDAISLRSGEFFEELAKKIGIPVEDLRKYEIFKEVPLITEGGFMKADIVLVKRNEVTNAIDDVIIIENKLSQATDYTPRQKEGWKKLANGEDLEVKYLVRDKINILEEGQTLVQNKIRTYKISDHGATSIDNVEISEINVKDYRN